MMNTQQISQWWGNPVNKTKKQIIILAAVLLALGLFLYGVNRVINWLHDVNYEHQQGVDKDKANQAESNASQHEANANQAAANLKELEKDEQNIKERKANQQKVLDADKRHSKNTRDAYDRALNKMPANRIGDDGIDDDQLRSDANRAAAAFNGQ